jgi:hypothetical protein
MGRQGKDFTMIRSLVATLVTWVTAAGLVFATVTPAIAQEATAPQATEYHYRATITPVYGSQYPITGRLDLEIFPSGIVRGYFWWAFQKQYITVVGGKDGTYIWLSIGPCMSQCEDFSELGLGSGPGGHLHVIAYMDSDNGFSGQVYPEYAASLSGQESVDAASGPAPTPTDQYTFVAKPIESSTNH